MTFSSQGSMIALPIFHSKSRQAEIEPRVRGNINASIASFPNAFEHPAITRPQAPRMTKKGPPRNSRPRASTRVSHHAVLKTPTPKTKDCTAIDRAIAASSSTTHHITGIAHFPPPTSTLPAEAR